MARTSAPKPAGKLAFVCEEIAMQASVTFNTHEAVKALKSSGFDEKQAESVVETIDKAVNETVATKADLALLGKTVEGIQENMATKMAKLETRIMRMMWVQSTILVGMLITVIGMLVPVVAKLL